MIAAILVSYRSAGLTARAAASFRDGARDAGLEAEVVAVVNSGDPEEARALEGCCDRVLFPGRNLGYAGGLNAGIAVARADVLVLANPDVVFLPGAVAALAAAVGGADPVLAGPVLYWDDAATLLLPPAERPGPAETARRVLARDAVRRGRVFRRAARRALAVEALARLGATREVAAVSGAVMTVRRETAERVGPLDERYRLYFEENDWQLRLRAAGGRCVVAGGARVVHRFAQSSRREPLSETWFRESERLYFESHFGERGLAALAFDAARSPAPDAGPPPARSLSWPDGGPVLVAVSPFPTFHPFVLARPASGARSFALPAEVASAHAGSLWYARAFDGTTFETVAEALLSAPDDGGPAAPR